MRSTSIICRILALQNTEVLLCNKICITTTLLHDKYLHANSYHASWNLANSNVLQQSHIWVVVGCVICDGICRGVDWWWFRGVAKVLNLIQLILDFSRIILFALGQYETINVIFNLFDTQLTRDMNQDINPRSRLKSNVWKLERNNIHDDRN